ncbi:MAG TPA: HEAT repeat domain-containing protein, partial [Pyrinomonadaceae bacterium]|nr:HEAT repeat domain-containing protein [Pyrinomonadaceae bacterium]
SKKTDILAVKTKPRVVAQPAEAPVQQANQKPARSVVGESERQPRGSAPQWDPTPPETEPSAYGAYRIDQEVGKLILGKPHRMDVMSSRVPDDRRAIEASLIKALSAPDTEDSGRQRARQALEEYGFVARQSAVMLQGRDAWERSSAARVLGQIGSGTSLPALVEALHDADSVVRNQAVTSLGQLKQPAAIGALLDIARRHSDIPPALLSESLSACSVDSLGYLDSASFDQSPGGGAGEGSGLEPLSTFEELPFGDDDDALLGLLTKLESPEAKDRAQIARELGLHPAQRTVSALCDTALNDSDPSVRSAAVTALGSIDHESVFAPVLIALADDTREVRAAAARTLSSLHFDRGAAYARVMESADQKMLQDFAQACVKTGIVSQAVDRLTSEDRRQAQEAFSLFSVLAKAGEIQPIFDVVENHTDLRVRLCAVRVLSVAGRADSVPKLRELAAIEGLPEDLRTSVLEVLYKLENETAVV